MVKEIHGSYKVEYLPLHATEPVILDFSPPWPRYSMVETIEQKTGATIPRDFGPECKKVLEGLVKKVEKEIDGVLVEEPRTTARLLDGLTG